MLAVAVLAGSLSLAAEEWPHYRGPHHNGTSPEGVAAAWPGSGPHRVWTAPTKNGFSSFAIADGRAFTLVTRDESGAPFEAVVAFDAETGRELWHQRLSVARYGHDGGNAGTPDNSGGDGPRSTPTVLGDRVYVYDGRFVLSCYDAATGRRHWQRDITREHNGPGLKWGNASSPVIEGKVILVAGGGRGEALLGIDADSGKTLWKTADDEPTHATPVLTTIHGRRQVIFFTQTGLVSLDPADGTELWRQDYRFSVSTAASPVVAGDIVYCSAGYGVGAGAYRISKEGDRFTVKELWRKPGQLENHWSTPVHHDGHLYGLYGFRSYGTAPLKCIELATGEEKWSQDGFGQGNVILAQGQLIVLGDAGQLVLVDADPSTYREKARADVLEGKCWSTPALANGRLYVRSTVEGACLDLTRRVALLSNPQ